MAQFAMVPRDLLYAQALHSPPVPVNASQETENGTGQAQKGQLTWQQKNRFRQRKKARKYKPLNLQELPASDRPAATAPGSARGPAPSSPSRANPPAPSNPAPANPLASTRHEKNLHSRKKRWNKARANATMKGPEETTLPQSAYIPPHLRKQASSGTQAMNVGQLQSPPIGHGPASPPPTPPSPTSEKPRGECVASNSPKTSSPDAGWGDPKPSSAWAGWDDPNHPSGEWGGWGNPNPSGECRGWEAQPQPIDPECPKNHRPKPAQHKTPRKWPKQSEMKPLPSDEDESDGGVGFKSDSNGDPEYDVKKLTDWEGNWLPPPESWSDRHRFTDRHFGASIEQWIDSHHQSCTADLTNLVSSDDFMGKKDGAGDCSSDSRVFICITAKELAPRSWIPTQIDGNAPQQFWRAFPSQAPPPLSDIDLNLRQPFWELYSADCSNHFIESPQAPPTFLDPNDADNRLPQARYSCTEALEALELKKQARIRKREEKRKQSRECSWPLPPPLPGLLSPDVSVYLRPIGPADVYGVQEIYNHYVANTISAPEYVPRQPNHIAERIRDVTEEGLPFIVAVDRGRACRGPLRCIKEPILGYTSLTDYCDKGSMYRFTFELELYVHPDYLRKGIAKCLLDRILETVDTSHKTKGDYPWLNDSGYLTHGSQRVVKTINVSVPHESEEDITWLTKFFKNHGFRKAGHLNTVGYKANKTVDVTIYQHHTPESINAGAPPQHPL